MKLKIRVQDRVMYNDYISTIYQFTIGEPLGLHPPHPGNVTWLCIDSSVNFNFEMWMSDTFGDTIPYVKLLRKGDGKGYGLTHVPSMAVALLEVPYSQVFYNDNAKLVFAALCDLNNTYLKFKECNPD